MSRTRLASAIGGLCLFSSTTWATISATQVISYVPGGSASNGFQISAAALGLPKPIADPVFGGSVLTPFNPPYLNSDIVIVGDGGQITLKLSDPVASAPGPEIGVFANNGLIDVDYPHGQNANPAGFFSSPPQAIVSVSQNGSTFIPISVNPITFDAPSNYFTDLASDPSFNTVGGTQAADFSKPFTGALADFNGLNWPATLALLNGSGGGEWLDFSSTGLTQVNYIRFEVPSGANYRMVIDAVTAVPESGVLTIATVVLFGSICRRR